MADDEKIKALEAQRAKMRTEIEKIDVEIGVQERKEDKQESVVDELKLKRKKHLTRLQSVSDELIAAYKESQRK